LCAVVLMAACGGKSKSSDTTPTSSGDDTSDHTSDVDESANMVPPEKMDEVQHALQRKEMIISRCLADAMENKEVPRGTHGKITFEIVMEPSGKPGSVKVDKTDIQAQSVIECAKKHVMDVQVSALPKQYETSYTYAMEAN
ncbi:MAG: hypothetical protein ACM31C_10355, partial [Acidobacteriota bacterium]